ncbi:MAG: pentapeptide repeat-containing protein [Pelosinus sp.]|nr:pentapeptide repeat-containing protein [Pelosinus sp.]
MNINNAFQHFLENEAAVEYQNSLLALDKYFHDNLRQLVDDCANALLTYFKYIQKEQQQGRKEKIAYIFASFLYTSLAEGKGVYRLDAYDENWFFDLAECTAEYDALWAYEYLHSLCAKLQEKSKKYVGKVTRYDIDLLKRLEAAKFSVYVDAIAREAVKIAVKSPEFAAVDKEAVLEIFIGEYKDQCRMLYRYDLRSKDSAVLTKKISEKISTDFNFAVWENLIFEDLTFGEADLRYVRFYGSTLKNVVFDQAMLWGFDAASTTIEDSRFIDNEMPSADFSRAQLLRCQFWGVDGESCGLTRDPYIGAMLPAGFKQAQLTETEFNDCLINEVSFAEAVFSGCSFCRSELKKTIFRGAKLDQCVFVDSDLSGADFRGAALTGCDFSNADLTGAIFSTGTDLAQLGLTSDDQVVLR